MPLRIDRRRSTLAAARSARVLMAAGASAGTARSSTSDSRSARSASVSMAARRTDSVWLWSTIRRAASASEIERATRGSFSRPSAISSAGACVGSRDCMMASAAMRRWPGSAALRRSTPRAAAIVWRTGLLTRTRRSCSGVTSVAGWPVSAARTLLSVPMTKTRRSPWRQPRRPLSSASTMSRAIGLPLRAISSTAAAVSGKRSVANLATVSSIGCARATGAATHRNARARRARAAEKGGKRFKPRVDRVPSGTRSLQSGCCRDASAYALPPHLPDLTLKLPHDIGLRQSEIRSFEPSR